VALDERVERGLEHLRHTRARPGVREEGLCLLVLVREPLVGGEVDPDQLGGERLDG